PAAAWRKSRPGSRGRTSPPAGMPCCRGRRNRRGPLRQVARVSCRGQHGRTPGIPVSALLGLDAGGAREVLVDARYALDLAFGGEALVEAFLAELARHFRPGPEALLPALQAPGFRLGVVARQVGAHAHHRLDGHRLGDHVVVLAPHRIAEHAARDLEEVADDGVVAWHFLGAAAGELDRAPAPAHPAVQLVEQLRLQHPLVALAAAAEAVDAV